MTFDEYQKTAFTTAIYPEKGSGSLSAISYVLLGLASETGEVAGQYKKVIRDNKGILTESLKESLIKEASDCVWYVSALCTELGVSFNEVAKMNLEKLLDRKERGVIGGSGDNR